MPRGSFSGFRWDLKYAEIQCYKGYLHLAAFVLLCFMDNGNGNGKVALPPGYVELLDDTKKLIEYLGFDPLFELGSMYLAANETDLRLRFELLKTITERVHARKTDTGGPGDNAIPMHIHLPARNPVKQLDVVGSGSTDTLEPTVDGERDEDGDERTG